MIFSTAWTTTIQNGREEVMGHSTETLWNKLTHTDRKTQLAQGI